MRAVFRADLVPLPSPSASRPLLGQGHRILDGFFQCLFARPDEAEEQGVRTQGAALELGVELATYVERVVWHLRDLHQPPVGGGAGKDHACILQGVPVCVVHLVAVAVAFADQLGAVDLLARVPGTIWHGQWPRRIVPPMSTPTWSGMMSMTGCGVSCSNSVELAISNPAALRANSITSICIPRQRPR